MLLLYPLSLSFLYYFSELDQRALHLVSNGLSFNSHKSYTTSLRRYLRYCHIYGFDPLRLEERNFLRFIAHLAADQLSLSTIRVYLAGIRAWVIRMGHPPPPIYSERVKWALRAVGKSTPDPLRASPISFIQLVQIQSSLRFTYDNLMLFTAASLAYFACLRSSEFCFNPQVSPPLLPSAVEFCRSSTPFCKLRIASSKTSSKGFSVIIGCSGARVCAHCNLATYLAHRNTDLSTPLFVFRDGRPLTHAHLSSFLKSNVPHAPHHRVTPHSLRAGAATDAALNRFSEQDIQRLGRWKSDAYKGYIRPSTSQQAQVATRLVRRS